MASKSPDGAVEQKFGRDTDDCRESGRRNGDETDRSAADSDHSRTTTEDSE